MNASTRAKRLHPNGRPLVLFYNSFFGSTPDIDRFTAGSGCDFTSDRRRLRDADAVVFHLPQHLAIGDARKYPGQLWVGWSMESKANTPIRSEPAVMRHFDLLMSFERSADVWCPYLPKLEEWQAAVSRPLPSKPQASPLVLFQSSANDRSQRNAFCSSLMRHISVDSYGRFHNNRPLPQPDRGATTKMEVIGGYKFCLALENSIEDDYVTEKFFHPLLAGTVPVYRGAPNVEVFAPGDTCYIDASKFRSPAELASYLDHLAHNDDSYRAYLAWREKPLRQSFLNMLKEAESEAFIRLAGLICDEPPVKAHALRPFGWRHYVETKLWRLTHRFKAWLGKG